MYSINRIMLFSLRLAIRVRAQKAKSQRHRDSVTSSKRRHTTHRPVAKNRLAMQLNSLSYSLPRSSSLLSPIYSPTMIPDKVYNLTQGKETVISYLAANPKATPGEAADKLWGKSGLAVKDSEKGQGLATKTKDHITNSHKAEETVKHAGTDLSQEDLDRAFECGKFGERPSDLFLKVSLKF